MWKYKSDLILFAALSLFCMLIWYWQTPRDAMTPGEVERYVQIIETNLPMLQNDKEAISRLRAFGLADDGKPAYMVNLMRYHQNVKQAQGMDANLSGSPEEANAHYESLVLPMALKSGSLPLYVGNVYEQSATSAHPAADNWNRVAVMRYPARRAFFDLLTDPGYKAALPYKLGALHVTLIPSAVEFAIPELRFLAIVLVVFIFLTVGYLRSLGTRAGR